MPTGESDPPRTLRLAAYCWVFFGVIMAIFGFVKGQGWPTALATGFLAGGAFAVLVTLLANYQRMNDPSEADDPALPGPQRRVAARAATRGAIPDDPEIRRAALRAAVHRLEQVSRHLTFVVSVLAGLFLLEVALAIMVSPLHWLGAALAALAAFARVGAHSRLRRRVELLNTVGIHPGPIPEPDPIPKPDPTPDPSPGPEPVPGH